MENNSSINGATDVLENESGQMNSSEDLDLSAFDLDEGHEESTEGGEKTITLGPGELLIDEKDKFVIDERYRDLDPLTGVYRTMQSKYDQTQHKLKEYENQNSELMPIKDIYTSLMEDPELARAFIQETHPDLFPKVDRKTQIEMELKKEFGEDFVFDKDEADNDPFSDSANYLARYRDLQRKDFSSTKTQSFKELTEKLQAEKQKQINENAQRMTKLKQDHKMDDNEFNQFQRWAVTFVSNPDALVKAFRYATRKNHKMPSLSKTPSGNRSGETVHQQLRNIVGDF